MDSGAPIPPFMEIGRPIRAAASFPGSAARFGRSFTLQWGNGRALPFTLARFRPQCDFGRLVKFLRPPGRVVVGTGGVRPRPPPPPPTEVRFQVGSAGLWPDLNGGRTSPLLSKPAAAAGRLCIGETGAHRRSAGALRSTPLPPQECHSRPGPGMTSAISGRHGGTGRRP